MMMMMMINVTMCCDIQQHKVASILWQVDRSVVHIRRRRVGRIPQSEYRQRVWCIGHNVTSYQHQGLTHLPLLYVISEVSESCVCPRL